MPRGWYTPAFAGASTVPEGDGTRRVVGFGHFEADLASGELRRQGIRVRLHGRPFDLLALLLERPGEVVTRGELKQRLWPDGTHVDFEHGLDNAANRLRAALGDSAASPRYVETLPRRGYRLIVPVEPRNGGPVASPPPAAPGAALRRLAASAAVAGVVLAGSSWLAVRWAADPAPQSAASSLPRDAVARREYIAGLYHQDRTDPASWERALGHFERTARLEPSFAPGHAGLAAALNRLGLAGLHPPAEAHARARAEAGVALQIDDGLAEAHLDLGTAKLRLEWDWAGALRSYDDALRLDPKLARAQHHRALVLGALGRWEEALDALGKARELEPGNVLYRADAGRVLYLARRYDEAIAQFHETLAIEPAHPLALKLLSDACLQTGRTPEAADALGRWLAAVGVDAEEVRLATRLLEEGGLPRLARRNLSNPAGKNLDDFGVPFKVALNHAALGGRDEAFEWLERARRQNDPRLIFLGVDPALDALRGDPRFAGVLRQVGL